MANPKSPTWTACKAALKNWPPDGLLALLHEMYELDEINRRFLHARLFAAVSTESVSTAERALARLLSTSSVFGGRFRHIDAKKIVDQFAKAVGDPATVAGLLLSDVAMACATFKEVGDCEQLVDHLYACVGRLQKLFEEIPRESLGELVGRADEIAQRYRRSFGYGISDELVGFAGHWKDELAKGDGGEA